MGFVKVGGEIADPSFRLMGPRVLGIEAVEVFLDTP